MTGTYLDMEGNPRSGTVTFAINAAVLIDITDKVLIGGGSPVTATLNGSGQFSVSLLCTDQLTPSGWAWNVVETISGAAGRTYDISLPHTLGSTVDLSTLVPAVPVTLVTPYLTAVQLGTPNGPASLDASGHVPASQLPAGFIAAMAAALA